MLKLKASEIEWFMALCLFVLFYIVYENTQQAAIIFGAIIVVFLIYAFLHHWHFHFKLNGYYLYLFAFCAFCYLSSFWALDSSYSIKKGNLLLQICLAIIVFYLIFNERKDIRSLLKVIQWGGYIILAYAVLRYGLSTFIYAIQNEERVSNEYLNANTLGMCAAYSIVINVYFMVYEKLRVADILIIPAIVVIAASGSRKGLIIAILGVIGVFIFKNYKNKHFMQSMLRILIVVAILILVIILLSRLSIFEGISIRMADLIAILTGRGSSDTSGWIRTQYNALGLQLFGQHPILGIGIDNARIYTFSMYGLDHYLHNNYVELAACGGIIGFVLYYSIYAYIFYTMIKYHSWRDREWDICMILLVIRLIMDYGCVAYETRGTYIYVLMFWLEAQKLKRESMNKVQKAVGNNSDSLYKKGYY